MSPAQLIVPLLALLVSGCDSAEVFTPDPGPHLGNYRLTAINGQDMPYVQIQGIQSITISFGSFELAESTRFRETAIISTVREALPGQTTTRTAVTEGRYERMGESFDFRYDDGNEFVGNLSGDTLRMTSGGFARVYVRVAQ